MTRRMLRAAREGVTVPFPQAGASRGDWFQSVSPGGLKALEFLERSRDMAAEPVTAAPRPSKP